MQCRLNPARERRGLAFREVSESYGFSASDSIGHQDFAIGLELLYRVPDLADAKAAIRSEADVKLPPVGRYGRPLQAGFPHAGGRPIW